jgi:DNA-binding response OmpR family regulator
MTADARRRILVVDDEPDMNKLVADVLTAYGFDAIQAASGEQALSILVRERPDAILLDLMLPGASGFELCKHLKGARATRPIPIIILTALDRPIDCRYAYETGADDYITKPFTPDGLVERLQAVLDQCRRQREECGHMVLTVDLVGAVSDLKAFNPLITCLYCQTDFAPEQIEALRAGLVRLSDAAGQWAQDHGGRPPVRLTIDLDARRLRLVVAPASDDGGAFLAEHLDAEAAVPSTYIDAGVIDQVTAEGNSVALEKALPPCGCQ